MKTNNNINKKKNRAEQNVQQLSENIKMGKMQSLKFCP